VISKQGICIAALCWAALVYCGIIPLPKQNRVTSLLPLSSAKTVTGRVVTNPVKTSSGAYYRFTLQLSGVTGICGAYLIESGAKGRVSVLFPAKILEANLPGKLYSAAKAQKRGGSDIADLLIESGVMLKLRGKVLPPFTDAHQAFSKLQGDTPTFFAETAERAWYDTSFPGKLAYFRALCRLSFKRILYAWGDAGGLFLALASGASEYTNADISGLFKSAGLAHVLALSGMHLSIFSGLTQSFTKKSGKRVSEILSIGMVCIFVWFAGFTPSLRRALIFFLLSIFAKRMGKEAGMTEILAATFFIHFFIAPEELLAVSFILSYAGMVGILVLAGFVNRLFARIPYGYGASSVSTSAGAFLATSPVSVMFWGYITPISIISSTVISPLITVFMVTGIICVLASFILPFLLFPLGGVMNVVYQCIALLVRFFAKAPPVIVIA
jgi:competence protein ComEC